jgi:ubiquinone/menaquinone biosynthesis C-methylase UbiE|tara:strand:- start:1115 stop:1903 length:789 start_codon:yes stop_codon:yes gene_type:complete
LIDDLIPAEIYERYLTPPIYAPWAEALAALAEPKPGDRVLDVACGTGAALRAVAPGIHPSGVAVGIDTDTAMLGVARAIRSDLDWREGSVTDLPFEDEAFSLILCQHGVPFFRDKAAALFEMHRVLMPGGRAVFGIWDSLDTSPGHHAVFTELGDLVGADKARPVAWLLSDTGEIHELLLGAGFSEITNSTETKISHFESARRFVELFIAGASTLTRETLAQIDDSVRESFIERVAVRLSDYDGKDGLAIPMRCHLIRAERA